MRLDISFWLLLMPFLLKHFQFLNPNKTLNYKNLFKNTNKKVIFKNKKTEKN